MKIACVTDDGVTISEHFGRAQFYAVVTVEDGRVTGHEVRPKFGHVHYSAQEDDGPHDGTSPASHEKHVGMSHAISDCEVLLSRGMGFGAYQSMQQIGITPVVTEEVTVEDAVQAYINGTLEDHPEKLH